MGHYETLRTEKFGTNHDLYLALKAKLMHQKSTEEVTIIGIPPITIISNGNNATVGLKGNEAHSGTPTPDNQIMPQGTGERTGNLFDKSSTVIYNAYFNDVNMWIASDDSRSIVIPVNGGTQYTLSIPEAMSVFRICEATQEPVIGNTYSRIVRASSAIDRYTFTTQSNTKYIIFQGGRTSIDIWFNGLMLNTGSIALPYEPYGYKILISSAGQTTPVYLGEVQTTRKVKKYEFTGQESIVADLTYSRFYFTLNNSLIIGVRKTPAFCTHWQVIDDGKPIADVPNNTLYSDSGNSRWFIKTTGYTTAADFKSYLTQQYAAGTPVTVWYILATEETAVVNEPLMKIGDYADEISGITIPTIKGTNIVDVNTEVKPSEISITYTKGKEININNIGDMEKLTIADLEKMTIAELEG